MHSIISSPATVDALASKIETQLEHTRIRLLARFCFGFEQHVHRIEEAIGEALAIARQTEFPHLVFPELATEMVRNLLPRLVVSHASFRPKYIAEIDASTVAA